MSIHVHWDNEFEDILVIAFEGDWTWSEYYGMGDQARQLLNERDQVTHIVYDFSSSTGMMRSPIMHMRYFASHLPTKVREGLAIYIGATIYWRTCVSAFNRVYPQLAQDHVYVSDLDDARDAVERKREQMALLADDDEDRDDHDETMPSRTSLRLNGSYR